jgi:nucleotide-binding universal stress UspA family protein
LEKVAVRVKKVYAQTGHALRELADLLADEPADLVVMGINGHGNAPSWVHRSLTHDSWRGTRTMTMFVPASGGFVSMAHGGFTLRRVLVPVNRRADPHAAVSYAFRAASLFTEEAVGMDVLHVGDDTEAPGLTLPEQDDLRGGFPARPGNVSDQIVRAASELDSDLIAMTTGMSGWLGALRGSVAERVVRNATCPVLAVPVA